MKRNQLKNKRPKQPGRRQRQQHREFMRLVEELPKRLAQIIPASLVPRGGSSVVTEWGWVGVSALVRHGDDSADVSAAIRLLVDRRHLIERNNCRQVSFPS